MPIRALKLKLIIPRNDTPAAVRARRALWATHRFVNESVAHYQRLLLELRQGNVCVGRDDKGRDVIEGAAIWTQRLRDRLGARGLPEEKVEAALPHCRALYRAIVPTPDPEDAEGAESSAGAAKYARSLHGLLVDPDSEAGAGVAVKLNTWAPLLSRLDADPADLVPLACELLEKTPSLLRVSGAPPSWIRRYRNGVAPITGIAAKPGWVESLVADLRKAQRKTQGSESLAIAALRELGALPLLNAYGWGQIEGYEKGLIPIERAAFVQAVAHLISWEVWCARAEASYVTRRSAVEDWEAKHAGADQSALEHVRAFEARRGMDLGATEPYRILARELRGWEEVQQWLKAHPDADADRRAGFVGELQDRLGRNFGSETVLKWLAHPAQSLVASGGIIRAVADYNGRLGLLERTRRYPTFTFAESRLHPRYSEFDPPNNSNSPPFRLLTGAHGALDVELDLLAPTDSGVLTRETMIFGLAPSAGQFDRVSLEGSAGSVEAVLAAEPEALAAIQLTTALPEEVATSLVAGGRPQLAIGKVSYEIKTYDAARRVCSLTAPDGTCDPNYKIPAVGERAELPVPKGKKPPQRVRFRAIDRLGYVQGQVGGSALLFDRERLMRSAPASLAAGHFAGTHHKHREGVDVWLKLSLDLDAPERAAVAKREKVRTYLSSAVQNRTKAGAKGSAPWDGFGVLSVNMGLRVPAAISVFRYGAEVGPDDSRIYKHERSALLRLAGDVPDAREAADRQEAEDAVRAIRASIRHLQFLGRLWRDDTPEARTKTLDRIGEPLYCVPNARASVEELVALREHSGSDTAEEWHGRTLAIYRRVEMALGKHIEKWRKETHRPSGHSLGGRSAWAVQHLERVRQILTSWHYHAHDPGRANTRRVDWEALGSHAAHLYEHIEHLKVDRANTTADLIVNAARGMIYVPPHWLDTKTGEVRGSQADGFSLTKGRWVARHRPVDLIVLEDMSRYRFSSDRPRYENVRLMQWTHRAVAESVRLQAELYGITVAETSTAYSSRFEATTGAPGVRCHVVSAADIEAPPLWLKKRADELGIKPAKLVTGDMLPSDGGHSFVPVSDGKRRDPDITSAQNVGRWYLEGHARLFRLRAAPLDSVVTASTKYVCTAPGKRTAGALGGGAALLTPSAKLDGFELTVYPSVALLARAIGVGRAALPVLDAEPEDAVPGELEDAEVVDSIETGSAETFFRDPSGAIASGRWLRAKDFWRAVEQAVIGILRTGGRLHG